MTNEVWVALIACVFLFLPVLLAVVVPCGHSHVWPTKDFQGEFIFVCAHCKRIQRRCGDKWVWTKQNLRQLYEEARQQKQETPVH